MELTTTLNKIKSRHPCISGWKTLLKSLNKTEADNEPLNLMYILKSNGIQDAIWCLRCFDYKNYCLFLADIAESVLPIYEDKYPDDNRVKSCIEAIRKYHAGKITKKELKTAADAAYADAAAAYAAYAYAAAADAAYAAAADVAAAYAAYAAAYAAYTDAADADAAAAYAADADDAAAYAYADARRERWQEIEQLFIKHFG